MAEPSALKPGKWQNRLTALVCSVWATPFCSPPFVPQKMQFPEQISCLCRLSTENSMPLPEDSQADSQSAKAKQATMRFLHADWLTAHCALCSQQTSTLRCRGTASAALPTEETSLMHWQDLQQHAHWHVQIFLSSARFLKYAWHASTENT